MKRIVRGLLLALLLATGAPVAAADQPTAPKAEAPATQPIPFRKDDDLGALAGNVALGLTISIALGIGVLLVLRRYLQRVQQAPGKRLRVLESVRLSPKSTLFLVEFDRRTLLLGQHGESLVVLAHPAAPHAAKQESDDAPRAA